VALTAALTSLVSSPLRVAAQRATTAPAATPVASLMDGPELDALKNLRWRSIGPANQAGRIPLVMGVPGDRSTYFVGAAAGGLLKTTNGGVTFTQLFDDQPVSSIGDLQIAATDPNTIYVGTGENNPRNSASIGMGVYKSIDAGKTWKYIGLDGTDKIARLRIDPRDANVVYVCALGHTWGPNEERGVFKTTDGGATWKKILYKNDLTGCSDLDIDPTNSNIVWAGMYTHQRYPWYFTSGAGETALYKSNDGGATWTKLSGPGNTRGLPKGDMDRIGISVHRANPDIVYVISETKDEGELWRTDDGGETWRTVNRDPNINFRPFYYSDVRVDPKNPNKVFTLSGSLYMSEDGGRTFQTTARDVHGDHQALWIDPTDPNYVINGSDGGWQVSYDGGRNWEIVNTYSFAQFYHLNLDNQKPYNICGGLQDNGHWCGPSRTLTDGNRKRDWVTVSGGDGFFAVPDIERPWLVYTASQGGNIIITDMRTGDARSIHPDPNRVGSAGDSLATHKFRFNWNSPIALDPKDPKTVYFGGNVLFKTTNFGQSWQQISGDLTTNDKRKQMNSGGPIVRDNTAAEFHSTLLSIAPSPKNPQVIWTGSDDGNVQVTQDGGKTWTNVVKNIAGLAPNAWISTVHASDHDAGTAYVAASHWQTNDYTPYAYVTRDYGKTWKRITSNLPARGWVHVVRDDPKNPNVLYLGTEFGPYVSFNGGERWYSLRLGLGAIPVRDLLVHPRDNELVIATHGRGLFILDDLTPLQQLGQALATNAKLFDIKPAARYVIWDDDGNLGQKVYGGENPPYGALVYYYSKNAGDTVRTTISDANGKQIRRLPVTTAQAGVNRIVWDLRYDAARAITPIAAGSGPGGGGGSGGGGGFFGGGGGGPPAVPGTYMVTITLGGTELKKSVTVEGDPRTQVAAAELQQQLEAALALRDLSTQVNGMVDRSNDLIRQLNNLTETLRRAAGSNGDQALKTALSEADAALKEVRALRDDKLVRPIQGLGYRQYPRLANEVQSLYGSVTRSYNRPTDPQVARQRELLDETSAVNSELQSIVNGRIAKLNELLKNTPHVLVGGRTIM
jgi:photosystem II stability/assembly factor-like uncharacterized protein